jgi:hypothetical protein
VLAKVLAQLFLFTVIIALQIGVNIYGWGLHPQNWWWIIGVGVFGSVFIRVTMDYVK